MKVAGVVFLALVGWATPATAQQRAVPDPPATRAAAEAGVDVFLINEGPAAAPAEPPARIEVTTGDGARVTLMPDGPVPATIAAGSFARLRYRAQMAGATPPRPPVIAPETALATGNGVASVLLDRILPYEPNYAVAGLGDAGAKLQLSLALRPFAGTGLLSRFHVAYTQTMFWAIDRPSGPFRQTTYSPELFFSHAVTPDLDLAAGYRHDSNGLDFPGSIDVNRLYVRAVRRFDLGSGWHAELVPQAWLYLSSPGAPDIERSWGFTAQKAAIGRQDGVKLAMTARGNPGTGRGGVELFASYPLARPLGFGVYAFGQGFAGYGEALDDYRIATTKLRIGIAVSR